MTPQPKKSTTLDVMLALSPIPVLGEMKAFDRVYNTNLSEMIAEGQPFTEADVVKRAKKDTLMTRSLLYFIEPVFVYSLTYALMDFSKMFR